MKSFITLSLIIFSFLAQAQEVEISEEYIRQKAELYDNAWEELDISSLPKEDKAKFEQEVTPMEYCAEKAHFYYTQLVNKFPNSKNYLSYLFNEGRLAADIEKLDDAKKCLTEVTRITESEKSNKLEILPLTDLRYYQKLSFYYLARICESENNCLDAKNYLAKLEKVQSDKLNEYQNWYIKNTVERINRNCSN